MSNDNDNDIDTFIPSSQDGDFAPLEYSVGEICKCYYNDVKKFTHERVSQSIAKCQSFGKVLERNRSDKREYTVELFDPIDNNRTRRVPGCCLRKVKVLPFSFEDASRHMGDIVRSKSDNERMMLVAVSRSGNAVRINDISAEELLADFEFVHDGSPCGRIVMLKADEAFGTSKTPKA